jgi:hypothetical protein
MDEQCQAEVLRIHNFFVKWLNGSNTVNNSDAVYEKECDSALAKDIILIKPSGNVIRYHELRRELREAHGSQTCFGMTIYNMQVVQPFLLLYEEWHFDGDTRTEKRQCTALFRPRSDAPCGVEWVHIHETSIQEGI